MLPDIAHRDTSFPLFTNNGTEPTKPDFSSITFLIRRKYRSQEIVRVPGHPNIFGDLFDEFKSPLFAYSYRITKNHETAEDILQTTFERASRRAAKIQTDTEIEVPAWFFRIAQNLSIDILRRERLIRPEDIDSFYTEYEYTDKRVPHPAIVSPDRPEQNVIRTEEAQQVSAVLDQLKSRHRIALVLFEWQGFSCDEIAIQMGTTRSAVKSILYQGRKKFRAKWNATFPNDPDPHLD